jgi:hypothetical protein
VYATPFTGFPGAAPAIGPTIAPVPVPGPVAGPPPACTCGTGRINPYCLARLKQWLCYRPIRGGCSKCCGCCPFNCLPQPYLYFLDDCHEGGCHHLPPPCPNENKCGCLGQLLSFGKGCGAP